MVARSALLLLAVLAAPLRAEQAESVAVVGVHFNDTSTEGDYFGKREDETARTRMLEDRLAEAFAERGYKIVDAAPMAEKVNSVVNIANSNGLDARVARDLGADLSVVGEVQKVSNLILTMNVLVRSAETGELLRAGNADIRANTDEAWLRGMNYVLENRIFPDGPIRAE